MLLRQRRAGISATVPPWQYTNQNLFVQPYWVKLPLSLALPCTVACRFDLKPNQTSVLAAPYFGKQPLANNNYIESSLRTMAAPALKALSLPFAR